MIGMTGVFSIKEFYAPLKGLKIQCSSNLFENEPFHHKTNIHGYECSREHRET